MTRLNEHLAQGVTTVARCWAVRRQDGVTFGFTDHDLPLEFDGITFKADSGMTARAVVSATGLSVDNSEAMGALSDAAISEAEIEAGRFDDAQVEAWIVNWADVAQRQLQFSGHIGELRRQGGAFHAELRGLTDRLNHVRGRVFHSNCAAVLGDRACGFDTSVEGFSTEILVEVVEKQRRFRFAALDGFEPAWFERGRLTVLSGAAEGLIGVVKRDRQLTDVREIEVWEAFRSALASGDMIRLEAGCDKRHATCRFKFDNLVNFQGFPHIPGEDWLMSTPQYAGSTTGGSLSSWNSDQ